MLNRKSNFVRAWLAVLAVGIISLAGCSYKNQETQTYIFTHLPTKAEQFAENKDGYTDVAVNPDGGVTVSLTESQRKKKIGDIKANLKQSIGAIQMMSKGSFKIAYADDYTTMDMQITSELDPNYVSPMIWSYIYSMEFIQVLEGKKDWSVQVTLHDMTSGNVIYSKNVPNEQLPFGG